MFDIEIAWMYGCGLGFNYTNEDIEGADRIADDLRHTIQIIAIIALINIHFYTDVSE